MFKEDDSYTKQQYLDEFGLEQILDNYNAEILKHDCNPICEKKIELIEKRNKVFRLLRDELKEVDPGCLITSVNDKKRENEFKVMPLSLLSKILKKITNIF
jgi:hypothetical protein